MTTAMYILSHIYLWSALGVKIWHCLSEHTETFQETAKDFQHPFFTFNRSISIMSIIPIVNTFVLVVICASEWDDYKNSKKPPQ